MPKKETAQDRMSAGAGRAEQFILLFLYLALVLLIMAGPYYRGLYFSAEFLVVHQLSFLLFAIYTTTRLRTGSPGFTFGLPELAFLLLTLFYFLSIFAAVNSRAALGEFLKIANYLVIYLLTMALCREAKSGLFLERSLPGQNKAKPGNLINNQPVSHELLYVFIISGALLAVVSLFALGGLEIYSGSYVVGRIFSPLQYANAAASYFMACFIIATGLLLLAEKGSHKLMLAIPCQVLFIALILTYSRMVFLLLPAVIILHLCLTKPGRRFLFALYYLAIIMVGLPAALLAYEAFLQGAYISGRIYIFLAPGISAILVILTGAWLPRITGRQRVLLASALVVMPLLFITWWIIAVISSPLEVHSSGYGQSGRFYHEHQVYRVQSESDYKLSLSAKAGEATGSTGSVESLWELEVLARVPDRYSNEYLSEELLVVNRSAVASWTEEHFYFTTPGETRRLIVRLYGSVDGEINPGADTGSVIFKNVYLEGVDAKRKITFNLHRVLPAEIYSRLTLFRFDLAEEPRIAHYRDAWQIIADYPFLGAGGGAWPALYASYMTRQYSTTEPHSHLLKIWLEAGPGAFLAYCAIWLFYACSFFLFRRAHTESTGATACPAAAAVFVAVTALFVHAAVDFNLSLGAVSILFFCMLAVGRSLIVPGSDRVEAKKGKQYYRAVLPAALLASCALLVCTFLLWLGLQSNLAARAELDRGNTGQAELLLRRASRLDGLEAKNQVLLAEVYSGQAVEAENYSDREHLTAKALVRAEKAVRLEPYNPKYISRYAGLLLDHGEIDKSLSLLERNISINPFRIDYYVYLAKAYLAAAEQELSDGNFDRAYLLAVRVLNLEEELLNYYYCSADIYYYLGSMHYLLGNNKQAKRYLIRVSRDQEEYIMANDLLMRMEK